MKASNPLLCHQSGPRLVTLRFRQWFLCRIDSIVQLAWVPSTCIGDAIYAHLRPIMFFQSLGSNGWCIFVAQQNKDLPAWTSRVILSLDWQIAFPCLMLCFSVHQVC